MNNVASERRATWGIIKTVSDPIKVAIVYPCDPLGSNIGGIESFIRGVLEAAPSHVNYQIVGATTDANARPIGRWTRCEYRGKNFDYFPLYTIKDPGVKPRIPATIWFEFCALFRMPRLDAQIIESHRIEHLLVRRRPAAYNLFLHQNMAILKTKEADIRWKFAPWLYAYLERSVLRRRGNVFCVREDAVKEYQAVYPELREKFQFQPTWMDSKMFFPITGEQRESRRRTTLRALNLDPSVTTGIAVGRLDGQKDPMLMIDAVKHYISAGYSFQLVWVGDGVLRRKVENRLQVLGIGDIVKFIGLREAQEIANLLQIADLFLMSSAYEGMPIAVLEALACGCPVVSTAVGEIPRLVEPGVNGYLVPHGDYSALSEAISSAVQNLAQIRGLPCSEIARRYTCENVLLPVYEGYADLVVANTKATRS